jgi:hypothetical protein
MKPRCSPAQGRRRSIVAPATTIGPLREVRDRRTSGSSRRSCDCSLGPRTVGIRIQNPSNEDKINAAPEASNAPLTPTRPAAVPQIQLPIAIPPAIAAW